MGLFDLFKKRNAKSESIYVVPMEEKKYYREDSYYTSVVHPGTPFEKKVITFDERKKTCIPSSSGLYVAEILLLSYCEKGLYPHPKNGYPGFWWFEYGIRNVDAALKDLERRGYIYLDAPDPSVLKVNELKGLLEKYNESPIGKKVDLIDRVKSIVPENELLEIGIERKYALTDMGKQELEENAYVPYMHSYPNKTTEDGPMNVWNMNKKLGTGDKSDWRRIVDKLEQKMESDTQKRNEKFLKDLERINPKQAALLRAQDEQIALVNERHQQFEQDKDLDSYIEFWESIRNNGGLLFNGSRWDFMLPDLYIKAKRYEEALRIVEELKHNSIYHDKAVNYIKRIQEKMQKLNG